MENLKAMTVRLINNCRYSPAGSTVRIVILGCILLTGICHSADLPDSSETLLTEFDIDCIQVLPRGVFNHDEFRRISILSVPGTLSRSDIEQTADNMMETEKLSRVEWDVTDAPCGRLLSFHLHRNSFIQNLTFEGNHQISDSLLRRATDLRKFGPFSSELLDEALKQLIHYYELRGFPSPKVSASVEGPDSEGWMDVVVSITETSLPAMESLDFVMTGHPSMWWNFRVKTLLKFLQWDAGRNGLNPVKLKKRLKKEERLLRDNGYRNATITFETDGDDAKATRATIAVDFAKPVRIRFDNVGFLTRRDLVANWKRKHITLDETELDRLGKLTLERLQNQGRLDAEVTTMMEERESVTIARVEAKPGLRYYVADVEQQGISPVAEEDLPRITGLYSPRFLRLIKTRPGPETLEKAEKALKTHLDNAGYQRSRARVGIAVDQADTAGVTAIVEPFPGPFQSIGSLEFEGANSIPHDELQTIADTFDVQSGEPFVNRAVRDMMTAITRLYWQRGFSDMTMRARTRQDEDKVHITFEIDEGPSYRQGPLIVAGNVKTRSSLVYKLSRMSSGRPFRLERAGTLQEAMYQTGVFDTVTIRTQKYPEAEPPYQTVIMDVTERSTGEFETGIDYNSDRGFEGVVEIGERNLFGRGLHGRLSGLLGTGRWGMALSFQRPVFWGFPLENRFRANISDDRSNSGYDLQKTKLEVGAVWRWRKDISLNVTYAFEREDVRNVDPDLSDSIDVESIQYGSLTPVLTIDKRDDPFRSASGWFYQTRFKSSLNTFGTQSEFFRWDHDARYFLPLDSDRIVAGIALRAGKAWLIRDSVLPAGERFYLGGATTNRGFKHQECGPKSADGTPLGGLSYLLINLEARFHLAGNWKGAIFADAGNVFADTPESPWLRPSAGVGLRYTTPIGPIRGDIGWNLDRQPGESVYAIQIALGHAF